jgi:hypothetical protein
VRARGDRDGVVVVCRDAGRAGGREREPMPLTLGDARRVEADARHGGDTVTLLQDAAGSGSAVMFPGTRESRPHAAAAASPVPAGGYTHASAPPFPDHAGPFAHGMMWLIDRLIALMRVAPSR